MEQNQVAAFAEENMKTIYAYALSRVSNREDAEELALEQDRQEQLARLRRELSLLSREYRECTLCYYFEGLSCQETAEKLGISLHMTKYYLFKTRKLLKEGIGMEREYGTKSYKPSKFTFKTLFSGSYNPEYRCLFDRLLPGNILLSAYYTPVTVGELALELGVPTAYLENEADLLVRYGLLNVLPGGKETGSGRDRYQTNIVILTEEYRGELYDKLTCLCTEPLADILGSLRSQLTSLRKIGFRGADLEEERLLWPLFWLLMHRGNRRFDQHGNGLYSYHPLYGDATGINMGISYSEAENPYTSSDFAGYARIDDNYAASFANFGILPPKNRYCQRDAETARCAIYSGSEAYVLFSQTELSKLETLLEPQIRAMADLYGQMVSLAQNLLLTHAPQSVAGLIPDVVGKTLFFDTVGLLGKCALDSGALRLPPTELPLAVFLYQIVPLQ